MREQSSRDVIASEKDVVVQLQSRLAQHLGAARFQLWFAGRTRFCLTDDGLNIAVADAFYRELLQRNFRKELDTFCRAEFGEAATVRLSIEPEMLASPQTTETPGNGIADGASNHRNDRTVGIDSTVEAKAIDGPKLALVTETEAVETSLSQVSASSVPAVQQAPAPQTTTLPFGLSHASSAAERTARDAKPARRRFAKLSDVVEGQSNRLALSTARNVAEHPGSFTPLVIHGPAGVGKTHLLEGIWCAAREQSRGLHVVYLTSEQFTTLFLSALRGNGLPAFRQKYRGVDVLIIDDVQFLCGKQATLGEFQYTIDTLVKSGKQIVLAADRDVSELRGLGREVISRLQSGVSCPIEVPDEAMRLKILMQQVYNQKLDMPPEVVSLIAKRVHGTARELSGALNRLRATSCAMGQPITEALARQTLAELFRSCKPVVGLAEVEKAVCDVFGVEPAELRSESKSKSLTGPRMLAMFLARKHTAAAYSEIGRYFGHRSHSTVMSAKKRIETWVRDGGQLHLYDRPCEVTDALRQVESRIRVG